MKMKFFRSSDGWAGESANIAESFGSLILVLRRNDLRLRGHYVPGAQRVFRGGQECGAKTSTERWLGLSGVLPALTPCKRSREQDVVFRGSRNLEVRATYES